MATRERARELAEKYRKIETMELKLYTEVGAMVSPEMAARPTTARPGTERKILRMSARYENGLPLYTKGDA